MKFLEKELNYQYFEKKDIKYMKVKFTIKPKQYLIYQIITTIY